jgi:hypothetical protein
MAVAHIQEWGAGGNSTGNYDALVARLEGKGAMPPPGLIVHTAGATSDGGFRIFEVWESREECQRFMQEQLLPLVRELTPEGGPPDRHDVYEPHALISP